MTIICVAATAGRVCTGPIWIWFPTAPTRSWPKPFIIRFIVSCSRGEAVNPQHCFIQSEFDGFKVQSPRGIYRSYQNHGLVCLVGKVLDDFQFELPWEYRRRDIRNVIRTLKSVQPSWLARSDVRVDVLKWVFYRNKAAYLVGRLVAGDELQPFVLAVLNNGRGELYVDALLCKKRHR